MSNGFIRLCSMVFCWAAISACHALLSSHMTNKDDDDFIKCLKAMHIQCAVGLGGRNSAHGISTDN